MKSCVLGLLFLPFITLVPGLQKQNQIWNWKCDDSKLACTRISVEEKKTNDTLYPSIDICRLICGKYGGIWPRPTNKCTLEKELTKFGSFKFEISIKDGEAKTFLQEAVNLFQRLFSSVNTSSCPESANVLSVHLEVESDDLVLDWSTNESYGIELLTNLENKTYTAEITSSTVFGARHALESLSQLIEVFPNDDESTCLTTVTKATIIDSPFYPHRGLLLDTTRNFQSISAIKKHIDGMGASKLNVLHWHITDSQSFPLELPNLPNMTKYGAYSADKIYHPHEIKDLLSYAKLRGVRILIEIDSPAHAGNGWQWGPEAGLGSLAVCVNQEPWRSYCIQPPCGQLNPVNHNLYNVLKLLFTDIFDILSWSKGEIFHMGGDEVYIPCWNSTPEIIQYLGNKPRTTETFLDLWAEYQAKALEALDSVAGKRPVILWTSHLTDIDVVEKYLDKERYIIQTWVPASDHLPSNLLSLGYKIIISTKDAWYLDHGFWGGTAYSDWQKVYNNQLPSQNGTLGGEVCMWGEHVDDSSVESRVWPRAAAAAERLWSNLNNKVNEDTTRRFYRHRERLVSRGINSGALGPRWCYQNEGAC